MCSSSLCFCLKMVLHSPHLRSSISPANCSASSYTGVYVTVVTCVKVAMYPHLHEVSAAVLLQLVEAVHLLLAHLAVQLVVTLPLRTRDPSRGT